MSEYLELLDEEEAWEEEDPYEDEEDVAIAAAKADRRADDARRREAHNAPKKIAELELRVEAAEEAVATLDAEMEAAASDSSRVQELFDDRSARQAEVDALYREWERLEELVAEAAGT